MADRMIAAEPLRAHKFSPHNRYLSRLGRALSSARRLRADLPSGDPVAKAAIGEWITAGEVAAVIIAART